jgi:CBS domain-containing protein
VKTVAYILKSKPDPRVHVIAPDATVFEAVGRMAEHNIGALVVMDGETVVGIVSERDYSRKIVLRGRSSKETAVREVMSSPVFSVAPGQSRDECMALMTERRLRHLPVVSEGRLIGMISIGDVVKDILSEQQFTIDQLERYISGAKG